MDELQEEEKELVKLWMSGYTYQEISDISNVNTKKVDNTLQKIKKILEGKKSEYEQIKDIFGGSI